MNKLEIKYRTWYKTPAPKPIKLEIPGWAGEPNGHTDGDKPQPWHCPPFVDGSTYGLELIYPFETECHITIKDGKLVFDGNFEEEQKNISEVKLPPFMSFAPGHFGMTSGLNIQVPEGYVLRTECHPRYYTDTTNTVPCMLPGHLQTEWWSKIFFVVFKNPLPGQTLIFRKNEPYGQVLIIPKKPIYSIKEMTISEISERSALEDKIEKYAKKIIKNNWTDYNGNSFNDRYKVISGIYAKEGLQGVKSYLDNLSSKNDDKKKIPGKLFIKKKK